ncbi:hypothetical protein TNCV_3892961 [Trichonephila clavipes]|nr:hypothetical protein TNCV_3892961 [Trichonephila clavipes]
MKEVWDELAYRFDVRRGTNGAQIDVDDRHLQLKKLNRSHPLNRVARISFKALFLLQFLFTGHDNDIQGLNKKSTSED